MPLFAVKQILKEKNNVRIYCHRQRLSNGMQICIDFLDNGVSLFLFFTA